MKKTFPGLAAFILLMILKGSMAFSQSALSIEKIMQDPKWMGTSPENPVWSDDGQSLYFTWNPEAEPDPSLYGIRLDEKKPYKVSEEEKKNIPQRSSVYNRDHTKRLFSSGGDLYLRDLQDGKTFRITQTSEYESSPAFSQKEDRVLFTREQNLYAWDISNGNLVQLTQFRQGGPTPEKKPYSNDLEKWLYEDQMKLFQVLRDRQENRDRRQESRQDEENVPPYTLYTGQARPMSVQLSPDERFIIYSLVEMVQGARQTLIPKFVTASGYTEEENSRPKVGTNYYRGSSLMIYDRQQDTAYAALTSDIPGLSDLPDYVRDYPAEMAKAGKEKERKVIFSSPIWSADGKQAVVNILSLDNKDRWIMLLDPESGHLSLVDRQRDEAWIDGPGIGMWGGTLGWLPDNRHVFFQSEESGFSHLYTVDIRNGKKKALTKGNFEVYDPFLSRDKKSWYYTSNEVHSGERHFYRMPVDGGKAERLTFMEGWNQASLSPDETMIALIHSESNMPEELYLKENRAGASPERITHSFTEEFLAYHWRKPRFITFPARDGAQVPARLYQPADPESGGPAVIFVHGAGYLQNAHKGWSSYFHEYMFHNFLVDQGYTVLDIDYRGSAGYGRDWRTAIYRHMGGKDLSDQVDGAKWLSENCQVDPGRIGIYGGSYGGFITLMAMFTEPGIFAAGAALRAVTDWAHYNHGYTSNILNIPTTDSLAYVRSSPIYYAEGLQGALLMCHGMIDDNVHFQDIVRLCQRLIELGKDNWELAVYPVERHAFTEPSSWTDEYKRIFKLFEENLK